MRSKCLLAYTEDRLPRQPILYSLFSITSILLLSLLLSPAGVQGQAETPPTQTITPAPIPAGILPTVTPQLDPILAEIMNRLSPITVMNIETLQEFTRWEAHEAQVTSLVLLPWDNELVSSSLAGSNRVPAIRLWQITDGSINAKGQTFEDAAASAVNIPQIQLSENGRLLTAALAGVTIWDARTQQRIGNIPTGAISAFPYDDYYIVVSGIDGLVSFWTFRLPGNPSGDYRETGILPVDFVYVPSPSPLITAFQAGEEVVQVNHAANVSFVLTRSGKLLMHTFVNGIGRMTEVAQEEQNSVTVPLAANGVLMTLLRNLQQVVYAGSHQDVVVYDYARQEQIARYPINAEVGCIVLDSVNGVLLIGDNKGVLHYLDTEDYQPIAQVDTQQPITACAFNSTNTWVAIGNPEGKIGLWGVLPE